MLGEGYPQTISPPLSESEEAYKNSCRTDISYEQLNANPDRYKGQRVTYQGTVAQVLEVEDEMHLRIDVGIFNFIWVTLRGKENIVEDDHVQIWGEVIGKHTYTSVAGWKITLPAVGGVFIEKVSLEGLKQGETARWKGLEVTLSAQEVPYDALPSPLLLSLIGEALLKALLENENRLGKFIIIDVEAKYTGAGSRYIWAGDFWVVDSQGFKYEPDSGTYLLENALKGITVHQNQKTTGRVLFRIPEQAEGLKVGFNFAPLGETPLLATWDINPTNTSGGGSTENTSSLIEETPPFQPTENELSTGVTLEVIGDGIADWTTEVVYSGGYSVKLILPSRSSSMSWALVKIPYGRSLKTIDSLYYYAYSDARLDEDFNNRLRVDLVLYLDKNEDGRVDNLLFADDV
ncbi:MAG: DUF4352 domain-containing protein [Candidatus Bathyarchaeia archaeon]